MSDTNNPNIPPPYGFGPAYQEWAKANILFLKRRINYLATYGGGSGSGIAIGNTVTDADGERVLFTDIDGKLAQSSSLTFDGYTFSTIGEVHVKSPFESLQSFDFTFGGSPVTGRILYTSPDGTQLIVTFPTNTTNEEILFPSDVSGTLALESYVDTFVTGLSPKTAVRVATALTLPASTYDNGLGTITASSPGVLTVDGVATVLGDRILVKDQADPIENGIYTVTTEGTGGAAFVLTRSTDANTGTELVAAYTYTGAEGSTLANKGFVQATPSPITLGTDPIVWNLFNSNTYSAGTGIRIGSGNLIYSKLSEGVTGGQDAVGGTAADDTFTLKGSSSTANRTTTAPAFIIKSMGPLAGSSGAQVFASIPVTVNASGTAGYTAIKVPITETATGSGTNNFIEFLGGASGTTSKFSIANTGTITVAAGANRFANDVSAVTADTSFTLSLSQNETWIRTGFTTAKTITVPPNSSVAFPIGAQINIAQWADSGTTTFVPFDGTVTIRSKGNFKTINGQYVWVTLKKVDTNEWALIGDLTT